MYRYTLILYLIFVIRMLIMYTAHEEGTEEIGGSWVLITIETV